MIKNNLILLFAVVLTANSYAQNFFDKEEILNNMILANAYFTDKWPDTGKTIITNKERPSNLKL